MHLKNEAELGGRVDYLTAEGLLARLPVERTIKVRDNCVAKARRDGAESARNVEVGGLRSSRRIDKAVCSTVEEGASIGLKGKYSWSRSGCRHLNTDETAEWPILR